MECVSVCSRMLLVYYAWWKLNTYHAYYCSGMKISLVEVEQILLLNENNFG